VAVLLHIIPFLMEEVMMASQVMLRWTVGHSALLADVAATPEVRVVAVAAAEAVPVVSELAAAEAQAEGMPVVAVAAAED
jgi:hypothetical protein